MDQIKLWLKISLLAFACSGVGMTVVNAQFLTWDYYNILDETRESGARPDMALDAAGRLHIVYWHSTEDRVIYMQQQAGGGWIREYIQPLNSNGYVARIAIDDNDIPHVVFMENVNFIAEYRYAYRTGPDNWVIEDIPNLYGDGYGGYGPGSPTVVSDRIQHSADILIEDDGTPQILFFDGTVSPNAFPTCTNGSSYDFRMVQATRIAGLWLVRDFGEVPDINNSCGDPFNPFPLPTGDRYGEFPNLIQKSDGSLEAFCHSRYNNQILRFQTTFNDTTWDESVIDSAFAHVSSTNYFWATIYLTFQGLDAEVDREDNVHLVYSASLEYGNNFAGMNETNPLVYAKVVGDDSVYTYNFDAIGSYTYRPFSDLVVSGLDTICIAYSDMVNFQLKSWQSFDGGQTWIGNTLTDHLGNARTPVVCDGDSFYVAYFDNERERLVLATQAVPEDTVSVLPDWNLRNITRSANHGVEFDAQIIAENNDLTGHILYNDEFNGGLFYGVATESGNWVYTQEIVGPTDSIYRAVNMILNQDGDPLGIFSAGTQQDLVFAERQNGQWTFDTILTASAASFTDLQLSNLDSVHVTWYDNDRQQLMHAQRALQGGSWVMDSIDVDSQAIGEFPSLALDGEIPHVAYYDGSALQLKYAHRDPVSRVWIRDTAITSISSPVGKFNDLKLDAAGNAIIACLDEQNTSILLAEWNSTQQDWDVSKIDTTNVPNMGRPIRLELDQFGKAWVAYNYNQNFDRIKLMHRDGQWREVAVSPTGRIADAFEFEILDGDLFLPGKKTEIRNTGLAMLAAPGGVFVERAEIALDAHQMSWNMFPNPTDGITTFQIQPDRSSRVTLEVFDLTGRSVAKILDDEKIIPGTLELDWDVSELKSGVYFAVLSDDLARSVRKLIVTN